MSNLSFDDSFNSVDSENDELNLNNSIDDDNIDDEKEHSSASSSTSTEEFDLSSTTSTSWPPSSFNNAFRRKSLSKPSHSRTSKVTSE